MKLTFFIPTGLNAKFRKNSGRSTRKKEIQHHYTQYFLINPGVLLDFCTISQDKSRQKKERESCFIFKAFRPIYFIKQIMKCFCPFYFCMTNKMKIR